jgi:uncharacterized Rmd1/YagE family protein
MTFRIRHCVECPKCHTRYLIASSPYRNGAYLVRTRLDRDEYTLYCFCDGWQMPNVWKWLQVKPCEVSKRAHRRGYGSLAEIWFINRRTGGEPQFDLPGKEHTNPQTLGGYLWARR